MDRCIDVPHRSRAHGVVGQDFEDRSRQVPSIRVAPSAVNRRAIGTRPDQQGSDAVRPVGAASGLSRHEPRAADRVIREALESPRTGEAGHDGLSSGADEDDSLAGIDQMGKVVRGTWAGRKRRIDVDIGHMGETIGRDPWWWLRSGGPPLQPSGSEVAEPP